MCVHLFFKINKVCCALLVLFACLFACLLSWSGGGFVLFPCVLKEAYGSFPSFPSTTHNTLASITVVKRSEVKRSEEKTVTKKKQAIPINCNAALV